MSLFHRKCGSRYVAHAISTGFLGKQEPAEVSEIIRCEADRGHAGLHGATLGYQVAYTWTDAQSLDAVAGRRPQRRTGMSARGVLIRLLDESGCDFCAVERDVRDFHRVWSTVHGACSRHFEFVRPRGTKKPAD